ncbi:MAG TPA: hypothetical protein VF399_01680 [bacterium]
MMIILLCTILQAAPVDVALNEDSYPFVGMLPELVVTASRMVNAEPDTLDWLPLLTVYGNRLEYDGNDPNVIQYERERKNYSLAARFVARHAGYILLAVFAITWIMILISRISATHPTSHMEHRVQTIPLHMLAQNTQALKLQAQKKNLHRYPKYK